MPRALSFDSKRGHGNDDDDICDSACLLSLPHQMFVDRTLRGLHIRFLEML